MRKLVWLMVAQAALIPVLAFGIWFFLFERPHAACVCFALIGVVGGWMSYTWKALKEQRNAVE